MSSRLLIVSFSVCPGPDRHGVQLTNALKALAPRYAVDVLTLRAGTMPFQERFMKTRMLRVPVVGSLAEQVDLFRRAIRRQLEGEEYDVVHLRSAWGARAVLGGLSGRFVYEVARSTEGEPRAADANLSEALAAEEQACLERAELVLVPTESARATLAARGMGSRVELVPPGVDVDHFDWEPAEPSDGIPRVVYAGRISGGRGVRLLLRATARLRARRAVKLVLAGDIDDGFARLLDRELAEAGLRPDDVERLGAIEHEDVPRVLAQATVCVAPSAPDDDKPLASFPTKILEYLACRRPVVAPRRPAVQEVINDGVTGLLFTPGDETDLARAIERLIGDASLRQRLGDAGYAHVREHHPASATRRRLLAAYMRLLPASAWSPPTAAVAAIDALPSHPDTTTARRPNPLHLGLSPHPNAPQAVFPLDGRAIGEKSGEIVVPRPRVVEFEAEPAGADEEPPARLPAALDEGFNEEVTTARFRVHGTVESSTGPSGGGSTGPSAPPSYGGAPPAVIVGFDDDSLADEKTQPRPLRPKNSSG